MTTIIFSISYYSGQCQKAGIFCHSLPYLFSSSHAAPVSTAPKPPVKKNNKINDTQKEEINILTIKLNNMHFINFLESVLDCSICSPVFPWMTEYRLTFEWDDEIPCTWSVFETSLDNDNWFSCIYFIRVWFSTWNLVFSPVQSQFVTEITILCCSLYLICHNFQCWKYFYKSNINLSVVLLTVEILFFQFIVKIIFSFRHTVVNCKHNCDS